MINIDIPKQNKIIAKHLVLDFNGTIAIDGKIISNVKDILNNLSKKIKIHILTADTFGSSRNEINGINCSLHILSNTFQDTQKKQYVTNLGKDSVIAIGNGKNDAFMLNEAAIGIAVIQEEGVYFKTLQNADIICTNIIDALNLISKEKRIIATLRN